MPHSWETVRVRQESVLIATVALPSGVSVDWAFALVQLQKPANWDACRLSGLPWGEARTQGAYQLLNGPHQFLFWLDADVIPPADTIMRLLSHRLPIVSALYHQRFLTWTGAEALYLPCMFNEGRDAQGNPTRVAITDYQPGALIECAYVPSGCILIHRSVFERLLQAGIKRFYEWTLHADQPSGKSEDFDFAAKARAVGFKCIVDTGIVAIHEAEAKVGPRGLSVRI